jgi:uncharacterized repeat protein (TIGR01451 family)
MRIGSACYGFVLVGLLIPALALGESQIKLSSIVEKKIVVVRDGEEVVERVKAEALSPDETVFYTIRYTNEDEEIATNVIIQHEIPEGTEFIPGSASDDEADVTFSTDGSETFNDAGLFNYEEDIGDDTAEEPRVSPESCTHIRWTFEEISAGESGEVYFQVRVK